MPARREQQQQTQTQQQQQQRPPARQQQTVTEQDVSMCRYALVQALMRAGCMKRSTALEKFEQLLGASSDDAFNALLVEQNKAMAGLGLEVRSLKHPVDGLAYVGLVNRLDDAHAWLGTHYKHGQREFFKHVLAAIAADPGAVGGVGSASSIMLLNMDVSAPVGGEEASETQAAAASEARKLTKAEREATLKQLADERWLQHSGSRPGHFCIGPRSFLELSEFLMSLDKPADTQAAWDEVL